jgi:N-acylneuraminate cytidylyltransferase
MVSTEDAEIAEIARKYGAEVPFMRSAKAADDHTNTWEVLEEVLSMYKKHGKEFEKICCVYPCVPFLSGNTLHAAYQKWMKAGADALQPVCKYPVPIEWAMEIKDGLLVPHDRAAQMIHSQDLSPKYFDAGMFYFCKADVMLREKTLTPSKTLGYILDESEVQDIDTIEDWNMAELKYRMLKEQKNG